MEFKLNDYHRNISDKELLEDIKKVAKQLGKSGITKDEYKNASVNILLILSKEDLVVG